MRENGAFDFRARRDRRRRQRAGWQPYAGVPPVAALSNGAVRARARLVSQFPVHAGARARTRLRRGPGVARDLSRSTWPAATRCWCCAPMPTSPRCDLRGRARACRRDGTPCVVVGARSRGGVLSRAPRRRRHDHRRVPVVRRLGARYVHRAARLALARGRLDLAQSVLLAWSGDGIGRHAAQPLPGPRRSARVQRGRCVALVRDRGVRVPAGRPRASRPPCARALLAAVASILDGYTRGTRFGIRMTDDGLLACGVPGVQLTWMDARVDGRVITPRIGKPVEVQALWINALRLAGGRLCGHAGARPRGLSRTLLERRRRLPVRCRRRRSRAGPRRPVACAPTSSSRSAACPIRWWMRRSARAIVDAVERDLLTPAGIRTLSPADPAYCGRYAGDPSRRDAAYHQGTAWPWLIGAFVDAWLRVHGDDAGTRAQARDRFLVPLQAHFAAYGLGHVGEIADGDAPHTPRGCPFQAWSVGELIRALRRTAPDASY